MARVRYQVAASLDGYIAGPKGEADWIPMDPDIDFAALWRQFDTLLMGRRTYEAMAVQGGTGTFSGKKVVVVSRTLGKADHPKVTVTADLEGTVRALRERKGKDIWLFGGGDLFRSALSLGLVDTVEVAVLPVLLGEGIPLLRSPAPRVTLVLTASRVYEKSGTVLLVYTVRREPDSGSRSRSAQSERRAAMGSVRAPRRAGR
jgi:dihydrofolate reductase